MNLTMSVIYDSNLSICMQNIRNKEYIERDTWEQRKENKVDNGSMS